MSFDISSNLGRDFSKGESVWGDISGGNLSKGGYVRGENVWRE